MAEWQWHIVWAEMGHDVCIYDSPNFPAQINAVNETGGIEAVAELHECPMLNAGFSKIALATTDIKAAMEFSDIFMMVCPSLHRKLCLTVCFHI